MQSKKMHMCLCRFNLLVYDSYMYTAMYMCSSDTVDYSVASIIQVTRTIMGNLSIFCHLMALAYNVMVTIAAQGNHTLVFDVSVYFIDFLHFSEPYMPLFVYDSSLGRSHTPYGNYASTAGFVLLTDTI